jgi:RNA recognition motif-containing protein
VRWIRLIKTLYVGNLPWSLTQEELLEAFEPHGKIQSARIIMDRETGRSRGFGFVEIEAGDAERAILAMNGSLVGGRPLIVNEAQSKPVGVPRRS